MMKKPDWLPTAKAITDFDLICYCGHSAHDHKEDIGPCLSEGCFCGMHSTLRSFLVSTGYTVIEQVAISQQDK